MSPLLNEYEIEINYTIIHHFNHNINTFLEKSERGCVPDFFYVLSLQVGTWALINQIEKNVAPQLQQARRRLNVVTNLGGRLFI
jgi:hypothetical protein